jgi:hypothetical protein
LKLAACTLSCAAPALLHVLPCPAGELYDLLDMYESQEAQQRLYRMKAGELFMHLALQGVRGQGARC